MAERLPTKLCRPQCGWSVENNLNITQTWAFKHAPSTTDFWCLQEITQVSPLGFLFIILKATLCPAFLESFILLSTHPYLFSVWWYPYVLSAYPCTAFNCLDLTLFSLTWPVLLREVAHSSLHILHFFSCYSV